MSAAPPSFANALQKEKSKLPLRSVQLEGQVLLKIAQHCADASLNTVLTGQLLGLDVGQTLEVTDAFPFPVCYIIIISSSLSLFTHIHTHITIPIP